MSQEKSTDVSKQTSQECVLRENIHHFEHDQVHDLVHSAKVEPDCGFPQSATAHDTIWDYLSLTPESIGMVMRVMSDKISADTEQMRQIYLRQTAHEQAHISLALVFELSKVAHTHVRDEIVGHLRHIEEGLAKRVAAGLAFDNMPAARKAAMTVKEMHPSPALQMIGKRKETLKGRAVGILIADGSDGDIIRRLEKAATDAGAFVKIIACRAGGAKLSDGSMLEVDGQLAGTPSVLFDAVAIILSDEGAARLSAEGAAVEFVRDAFGHLKAIAADKGGQEVLKTANVGKDAGVVDANETDAFIAAAKTLQWSRKKTR